MTCRRHDHITYRASHKINGKKYDFHTCNKCGNLIVTKPMRRRPDRMMADIECREGFTEELLAWAMLAEEASD